MEIRSNNKAKHRSQRLAFGIFRLLSLCIVLILFAILGFIIYKGAGAISWDFITSAPTDGMTGGGIWPAIVGTFYLMVGSALFAFPVGVMSGIYMNEYAPKGKLVRFIRVMTNNLSGIPSIVFGLFGMALFVNYMGFGDSILAGSLTLGLLCVPLVIRTTEEALKAIPDSMREGSRALGDDLACDSSDGDAEHHYRINPCFGTCFRRDGTDSVYLCRLLPAAVADEHSGPVYGAAVSPVCDFDQRNGYGSAVAVGLWYGFGTDCDYPFG
jgi:hypothetical protein